ncbi:MAG: tetratricopeptide repeat protein [Anaerolineae bacterium]|nr:tetratricopeptide repeat protein [Anaerolineae bacterium]
MKSISKFALIVMALFVAMYPQSATNAQAADSAVCDLFPNMDSNKARAQAYYDLYSWLPDAEAIASLDCALQLDPDYADAYYALGRIYQEQENYAEANFNYRLAIAMNYQPLSVVYTARGYSYNDLTLYEEAIKDFSNAVELDSKSDAAYYGRAYAYRMLSDFGNAIENMSRAIEFGGEAVLGEYFNERGMLYLEVDDYKKALSDYTLALEHGQQDSEVYAGRGMAYHWQGQFTEAVEDYTQAIELKPEWAMIYYARGRAWEELREEKNAIADYSTAIELNPTDVSGYLARADIYFMSDAYKLALADYNTALELGIEDEGVGNAPYVARGTIYLETQAYQQAEADLLKALEIDPNDVNTYATLGYLYFEVEMFPEALDCYQIYLDRVGPGAAPQVEAIVDGLRALVTEEPYY